MLISLHNFIEYLKGEYKQGKLIYYFKIKVEGREESILKSKIKNQKSKMLVS